MTNVVISEAAEEEFAEALLWYSQRSVLAANEFDHELDQAIKQIAADPSR